MLLLAVDKVVDDVVGVAVEVGEIVEEVVAGGVDESSSENQYSWLYKYVVVVYRL